ncbi:hypothetical protein MMC24_001615 [Lignoscripta atroalba]|nr:hypothetical protein [Lignoscripta atroalba]
MSPASYFASAFRLYSDNIRSSLHKPSRKRKRDDAATDEGPFDGDLSGRLSTTTPSSPSGCRNSYTQHSSVSTEAVFNHVAADQYRVAGQPFDEPLPGAKFPHAPLPGSRQTAESNTQTELDEVLANLNPPLYGSRGNPIVNAQHGRQSSSTGLRRQHLTVLTTIMHKCLLQGDYIRAGRAWGLLLRAEIHGQPWDIRTCGRWGIGAEILLQRDAQIALRQDANQHHCMDSDLSSSQDTPGENLDYHPLYSQTFGKEGFTRAKSYYERLILQYPFRKTSPTSTSALDFYPLMFGLWICSVQDEYKSVLSDNLKPSESEDSEDDTPFEVHSNKKTKSLKHALDRKESIRKAVLHEAVEISTRLDELLLSPPYSDDVTLWQLCGMVALWVGDLSVVGSSSLARSGTGSDDGESEHSWSSMEGGVVQQDRRMARALARSEYEKSLAIKHQNVEKARTAFRRVIARKGTLWEGVRFVLRESIEDP